MKTTILQLHTVLPLNSILSILFSSIFIFKAPLKVLFISYSYNLNLLFPRSFQTSSFPLHLSFSSLFNLPIYTILPHCIYLLISLANSHHTIPIILLSISSVLSITFSLVLYFFCIKTASLM